MPTADSSLAVNGGRLAVGRSAHEDLSEQFRELQDSAASSRERERYQRVLRSLGRPNYGSAFEPGCSTGALTELLASRCQSLLATDIAPTAVRCARDRCANLPNVTIKVADLSAGLPPRAFDLIVLSEIGYYFGVAQLAALATAIAAHLRPGGEVLAAHGLGHGNDHALHGDRVHRILFDHFPLNWTYHDRCGGYRIDRWMRP